jgi:membrane protein
MKSPSSPPTSESPLDLPQRGWKQALKSTRVEVKQDRVGLVSAGIAYYWFLGVFPGLIALVGLLDLLNMGPNALASVEQAVRSALPGDAANVLVDALRDTGSQRQGASAIATIVGIRLALWSASAGMVALQTGLDIAYDVEDERKFVRKRLYALMMIAAGGLLGGGAAILLITGAAIGRWIDANLIGGGAFLVAWTVIRWLVALGLLTVLIALFYYLGPNRDSPRWTWITPGGVVVTLIWVVLPWLSLSTSQTSDLMPRPMVPWQVWWS